MQHLLLERRGVAVDELHSSGMVPRPDCLVRDDCNLANLGDIFWGKLDVQRAEVLLEVLQSRCEHPKFSI